MRTQCLNAAVTIVCIASLSAAAMAQNQDRPIVQVDVKILQVDPEKPAGSRIIAAWNAAVEKVRQPAEDRPAPTDGATKPGQANEKHAMTFDVLACDPAPLFGDVLNGAQEAASAGQLLTAPRLLAYVGEEASVSVGRQVPYMVQRDDGSLVVERSDDLLEGIFYDVTVSDVNAAQSDGEWTCLVDFHLKMSNVVGRQPIADVPFDVGRPIISSQETNSTVRLAAGTNVVMRLPKPSADDQPIFVVLSVKPQAATQDTLPKP